jgi:hypothetical protein
MILKLFEVFFFPALIYWLTQDKDGDEVYEQRQEEGCKPQ